MDITHHCALFLQRQAVVRAIERARECRADNDAEILESVVALLDELAELARRISTPPKRTNH
jgi:anti-sigma factor ChrR (cupin superfamily)